MQFQIRTESPAQPRGWRAGMEWNFPHFLNTIPNKKSKGKKNILASESYL